INPELAITPEILEYAIESDEKELALKIINGAKDLNVCFTGSPLELAVYYGKLDLVKLLIENGADINYIIPAEGGEYHTVMHTAVVCPSKEILMYLLDHGGDVSVEDFEGCTPYDYAKESKLTENMRILKEYQNEKKYGRDEYDENK
ncbi:MAG: ankyrin repeat domain-containing protein, partial [Lachnospiraceae bacterium]